MAAQFWMGFASGSAVTLVALALIAWRLARYMLRERDHEVYRDDDRSFGDLATRQPMRKAS